MEKSKIIKLTNLIAGIFSILAALFLFIIAIINLTYQSDDGKYIAYLTIGTILRFAEVIGLIFLGVMSILGFFKNKENNKSATLCIGVFLLIDVIFTFINMCFFGFNDAYWWVIFIFGLIALILMILSLIAKFSKTANIVLYISFLLISFVIICLYFSMLPTGLSAAYDSFIFLALIALITSFILSLIFKTEPNK